MTRRRPALVVLLAAVLAVAGCGSGSSDETGTPRPTTPSSKQDGVQLTDLTSVEQLRTRFNEDRGAPRLILLLSPT